MKSHAAKLDKSGRVLIPVELRREMGIKAGDKLTLLLDFEGLHLSTPALALARAQTFVRGLGLRERSLAAELIAERRRETAEDET